MLKYTPAKTNRPFCSNFLQAKPVDISARKPHIFRLKFPDMGSQKFTGKGSIFLAEEIVGQAQELEQKGL